MDFFEAQARAKKRTSRLVVLFAVAVLGTILAGYFAALFGLRQAGSARQLPRVRYFNAAPPPDDLPLWQPRVFGLVTLATVAVVGLASLYKWSEYGGGGGAVAESLGGRRVDSHTLDPHERRLLNVVEEMAIAAGLPVPAVYLLDEEPGINAFAAGLTTSDAVVTVTRGTLEKLTRDELQGVIGHEFSHILNGDMRLNLRIAALVFGILVLGLAGRGVLWSLRGVRVGSRDDKGSGGVMIALAFVGLALLVVGYVGYFFGRLIQAGVSRQREFLADASAVQFTRNPGGVTGALKKIGGYALGSTILHNQSAAIGHFFFAQSFLTGVTGLWATHPPLDERIRAIDPGFDGKFFDPPQVVDVAHESFLAAGLVPPTKRPTPTTASTALGSPGSGLAVEGRAPSRPPLPFAASASASVNPQSAIPHPQLNAVAMVASVGTLTPQQIVNAQLLLDATPPPLRAATQTARDAAVLLYGLLLDDDDGIRSRQRTLVATRAGGDALRTLDDLEPALRTVGPEQKLPLLQLALPALRQLPPSELPSFLDTLDELVHADGRVSTFEFALQKLLLRSLALGRAPGAAVVQIYSFHAVTSEISIVLSTLARASTSDPAFAGQAFAAGAAQLKLIETQLPFLDETAASLAALDAALDRLAAASLPIKQRTLYAAAHVVSADGQVLVAEFELLRAVAAALDCPMPPLAVAA